MEVFLTFLVITYRRPKKVARLLQLFQDPRWKELEHLGFEIVVADDHGEDDTRVMVDPVIRDLVASGWAVRYVYRETNLRGDRNLYYGYTRDSSGKYVWFLCDDDLFDVGQAISYIRHVHQTSPLISLCGFVQGRNNEYRNQLGNQPRLVYDFQEAVGYLIQFPKTTAYLMRRCPEIDLDSAFERWDFTLHSWVGIAICLFAARKTEGLLLYPAIVASADDDFGLLQYSYRIFKNLYWVTKDSIELSGMSFERTGSNFVNLGPADEMCLCINGLHAHFSSRGHTSYTSEVLGKELSFLREHWIAIFLSPRRLALFGRFAFFFLGSYAIRRMRCSRLGIAVAKVMGGL